MKIIYERVTSDIWAVLVVFVVVAVFASALGIIAYAVFEKLYL